jgi:AmmeMemoRadiSam system protein B
LIDIDGDRMTATPVRHPAVAGRFYPADAAALRAEVETHLALPQITPPLVAIGCIAPHAGYLYSGHVAGAVFSSVEIPQICIVLCPNHTGIGRPLAIMSEGAWETPLGRVEIEGNVAAALQQRFPLLEEDSTAHRSEHAAEVELPFLQVRRAGLKSDLQSSLKIVPIAIGTGNLEVLEQLGLALAEVTARHQQPILIVASSDMNHYESDAITRMKDEKAIETILALDAHRLQDAVMSQHISMCGFGPAVAMLTAAKKLGATSAQLLKYATSGDISGDRKLVVGYAGIVVS